MKYSTTQTRAAWQKAICSLPAAPQRLTRPAVKPSIKAQMAAQGIHSGVDALLGFTHRADAILAAPPFEGIK